MSLVDEVARPIERPDCPYVGLRDFTETHAEFFFGRDGERKRIIGNLRASRLTVLYAESGVGKSSLLRAGVVPRLAKLFRRGQPTTGTRHLPVIFSTWSGDSTNALIDAVADAVNSFEDIACELPRGSLMDAIEAAVQVSDATLLVILDQFEELFLYRTADSEDQIADELARCINRQDLRVHFLISVREDMYASVGELLNGRVPNVYGNYLHLDYLDREAAKQAITEPIDRFNQLRPGEPPVDLGPGLADAVLDQVRRGEVETGETDSAPSGQLRRGTTTGIETTYLQLVLKRLWDEEAAVGSPVLRLETLERLGGAQTVIATHLDDAMAELPEDQRDAAAAVFRFLVTSAGTKIALSVGDLAELSDLDPSLIGSTLRRLSAPDLHILRPVVLRDSPEHPRYEIFHDALAQPILAWRSRHSRQQLDAALEMERQQKELAQREANASARRAAHERTRKRWALAGFAIAIVFLLVTLTAFAVTQRNAAKQKADRLASISAIGRITAAYGSTSIGGDAVALASLEAARLGDMFEARSEALGALQSNVGRPAIGYGQTRSGNAVVFLSNAYVAGGSSDGVVRIWDGDARPAAELTTDRTAVVSGLAVTSFGRRQMLAAARGDGNVDLWDVTQPAHPGQVPFATIAIAGKPTENTVAFSPDGTVLAIGGVSSLTLWDVRDAVHPLLLGTVPDVGTVRALAFDTAGRHLAAATNDGVAVLSGPDFVSADPAWVDDNAARSVAYSPSGLLAYSLDDSQHPGVALLGPTGAPRLIATVGVVYALAFAEGGRVLVSGGTDGGVTTWDVDTLTEFGPPRTEDGYGNTVFAVAMSPDGKTIAEVGGDRFLKLWPLDDSDPLASIIGSLPARRAGQDDKDEEPEAQRIWDIAPGPSGQVAAATDDGAVVWDPDPNAGASLPRTPVSIPSYSDTTPTYSVAFAGDVLAVADGSTVTTWRTGPACTTWPTAACPISTSPSTSNHHIFTVRFDRTGRILAAGDLDGDVTMWRVDGGRIGTQIASWTSDTTSTPEIGDLAFSATADLLAVGTYGGALELYDIRTPERPRLLKHTVPHGGQPVTAVAFSPDGRMLASGGLDQRTVLWSVNPAADDAFSALPGLPFFQTNSILSLAFSPNGQVLAAADGDGSICLYDVPSHRAIGGCMTPHESSENLSGMRAVAFTGDGSALLSAGDGNPLEQWNAALWAASGDAASRDRLAAAVCGVAGRNLTEAEWNQAFVDTSLVGKRHRTCPAYPLP